ncbi:DUF1045 domain-containing protein [Pseudaestuariivita sp.]|uniref:DUF1045 domain-containing protein n=1 Tax=Pseudaestuariivita sp. TaxID=2211669 RepID=UPI0040588AB8
MKYARHAIYFTPRAGALAEAGARWLGWDVLRGVPVPKPDLAGLDAVTRTPRKYGFHATLKPPFRLAEGMTGDQLCAAVEALAERTPAARCAGLQVATIGRFLALVPLGSQDDLASVAAACVQELDDFRAAPTAEETERRRKAQLTPRQEALLARWGYPYVLDEFRFHMTLTGPIPTADLPLWTERVAAHFPPMPAPFVLDQIALCGERQDSAFEVIGQFPLRGAA